MSKIIVDEIQANGGDTLTIPSTDATANNQPIVGSTAGALTFSPLALPSADGDANKPLTTDGSAQLQFGGFALPATAGTDGQVLTSTGTAAAWEAVDAGASLLSAEGTNLIGSIVTTSGQGQSYNNGAWNTSGPYTTYRHDQFFTNANSRLQGWNMFMGDGYPDGTTQNMYANTSGESDSRLIQYAYGKRCGWYNKDYHYESNQTSYCGLTWRCMPIRNTSGSDISVTVAAQYTSYTTYSSASWGYFTPTNSSGTTYSTVTGGTWTSISNTTTNHVSTWSQSITIPAGKTVLVFNNSAHRYETTYRFPDTNMFYNVDTTFSDSNIICDLRILYAMHQIRSTGATYNGTERPEDVYTLAGTLYGDR